MVNDYYECTMCDTFKLKRSIPLETATLGTNDSSLGNTFVKKLFGYSFTGLSTYRNLKKKINKKKKKKNHFLDKIHYVDTCFT